MTGNKPFVREDVRAFLAIVAAMNRPDMRDVPLDEVRAGMVTMTAMADLPPRELAVIRDLSCPGPGGEIPLRFYAARAARRPGPGHDRSRLPARSRGGRSALAVHVTLPARTASSGTSRLAGRFIAATIARKARTSSRTNGLLPVISCPFSTIFG